MEEKGIKETLEASLFGAAVGKAVIDLATGKVSKWTAVGAFLPAITFLENAIAGIEKVPAELADLSDAELKVLREQVQLQLGLVDQNDIKRAVDGSLFIARGVGEFMAIAMKK